MHFELEPQARPSHSSRVAVLLINLGTPDAPTPRAVRRYLAEFLSDPRVIEIPALIWQWILRLFILPLRGRPVAAKYASIWLPEGSPLRVYTEQQAKALQQQLKAPGDEVSVEYAMRYGARNIPAMLTQLKRAGIERILLVPMYPQYCAATTASSFDRAFTALQHMRNQPELRTIRHYADFPPYIAALAAQVRAHWAVHGKPDFALGGRLLLSFHGVPKRIIDLGDPYYIHCQLTATLLAQALNLSETESLLTFQSRFGRAAWLKPDTALVLKELGAAGVRRVDVFCPGFPADCLETLEEIGMEGRDIFLQAGGEEYHYIQCLNAAPSFIASLAELVRVHLQGWVAQNSSGPLLK